MVLVRLILLALGLGFFAYLVATTGLETLLTSIQSLSWWLLLVVAFPAALVVTLDTFGWRFAFRRNLASFLTLFSVRLAGEAFNATTPTASVGGEPVKAYLLRPRVPLEEGLVSVIVAKTTSVLAQGFFLVVGIALAFVAMPQASPLLEGMTWLAAVEALALGGFVLAQQKGLLGGGPSRSSPRWLSRPSPPPSSPRRFSSRRDSGPWKAGVWPSLPPSGSGRDSGSP